jgi:cytochrome c oxidase subunit 2
MLRKIGTAAALGLASHAALADYQLNFREPNSPVGAAIYDLHTLIMLVCLGIFVVVFGAMFYALINHRKSKGHEAHHFHENTTVEIVWTVIPFAILIGMAYPATKIVLDMKDTSNPDISIKVTGYQWKWGYDYLNEGISFYSMLSTPKAQIEGTEPKGEHYLLETDNDIVVPVGKRVRLLITANDVIHAWWVPALAAKQDAIPGFIRDTWFKAEKVGTYRGQCAELCGKDHGFMPIVVKVVEQAEYDAWVASKKQGAVAVKADDNKTFNADELMARGEQVYNANCAACHQANGQGIAGTFPAISGSKVATGPIADHIKTVMEGRAGTAMAGFAAQLSDADIAAVVTYQRNAWDNHAGDAAQPADIAKARG